ncbi:MAG: NAD(P)/FAD-dependent oxidoreductase [Deltaproteobacteria bacterium]|nr:NAD(P)/FAD-dependent oxidoreductase [Deltaproteobacteria bacterium]
METEKPFDALIIGSGIGGLSTGIILSRLRYRVAVIEKNPLPGGLMRGYSRDGIDCPVGVHYFGAFGESQPLRRMFDYLGVGGALAAERMGQNGPIDRYLFDDFTFDLPEGLDAFAEALESSFPEDYRPIATILGNLCAMADLQNSLSFLSPAIPFLKEDLLLPLSVYLMKMKCTSRLRSVLSVASRWMGLSEQDCPVLYHHLALASYLLSAWRLVGSGADMAEAFVAQLAKRGGSLICNDPAAAILAEGKEVAGLRLASGRVLKASRIVAAVHPKTVLMMLPEGSVKPLQARRIRGFADTESLFVANFAVDARTRPALPHNIYRLHADSEGWIPAGVFYQLRAGGKDRNLLTMITKSSFSEWRRWEGTTTGGRGADYREEKIRRAECLLGKAEEIFGSLAGAKIIDAYTPLTLRDRVNSPCGSPYGVMRSTRQFPAMAVLHRRPLNGLFFAGQNALAPGILGTVMGSFHAVRQMIGQERFDRDVFVKLFAG